MLFFLLSVDFFQNTFFLKIVSEMPLVSNSLDLAMLSARGTHRYVIEEFRAFLVYRAQFMTLAWLLNDGGCGPTPPVSFSCREIQSLEGHAVPIVSDSNMVSTSKI